MVTTPDRYYTVDDLDELFEDIGVGADFREVKKQYEKIKKKSPGVPYFPIYSSGI